MKNRTDDTEFLQMLRQCEGSLLGVCLRFGRGDRDAVRDLYQDIVCTLWDAWPAFRHRSDAATWATAVAVKVAAQTRRRRRQMPTFVQLDESVYDMLADEGDDPRYRRLFALVDQLSETDRQLLYLHLDRIPTHTIAALLDLTDVGVRQRLRRIRKRLVKLNEEYDE